MLSILNAFEMKKNLLPSRYISIFLTFMLFLSIQLVSFGQIPPPPPPPNGGLGTGHGLGGNQGTPGAPIGGGFELLIALGAFYAGKKMLKTKDHQEKDEE